MNRDKIKYTITVILHSLILAPLSLFAQIDCDTLPRMISLKNHATINQQHIFCGEWDRDRPKGFHSRPNGKNPLVVEQLSIQSKANKSGIYTARWTHVRNPKREKFSSMFPDQCTQQQILNSIHYASLNTVQCPANSTNWLQCGKNKPLNTSEKDSLQYCSYNNTFFTMGLAFDRKGRINTAFPIFE